MLIADFAICKNKQWDIFGSSTAGRAHTRSTVRKHRENIMAKLGLNSTAQLVRAAMQIGQY